MKKIIASLAVVLLISSATIAAAAPSTIQATVAKFKMIVDGETKNAKEYQLVYNGTTYVALREVAGFFGYDTKYDGPNQLIEFTPTGNSVQAESSDVTIDWVSLYEFETLNSDIKISQKDTVGSYKIVEGDVELFSLYTSNLKDGDVGGTTTKDGAVINVKKYLGSILLNKADLKKAGFNI